MSEEPSIAVREAPERGRNEATLVGALAGVAAWHPELRDLVPEDALHPLEAGAG